jgi:hypothetical protein
VLRWLLLVVCLVTASAVARAETTQGATQGATEADIVKVSQLTAQLQTDLAAESRLKAQYAGQTSGIDQLKQRPRSWKNDRELNSAQADANETLQKLDAVQGDERATQAKLKSAQKELVGAIDAELAAGTSDARKQKLATLRAALVPQVASTPKKIVIPNSDIDDAADPEELEQKAAALKQAEAELAKQEDALGNQAKELDAVAKARREHDRAQEVVARDDDQPHRQTSSHGGAADHEGTGAANGGNQTPTAGGGAGAGSGGGGGGGGAGGASAPPASLSNNPSTNAGDRGYESDATAVLDGVVDKSTLDNLRRAQSSNDPAQRAVAAKAAHDAVAAKREQLRKKREAIEARARQLRGGKK